MVRYGAFAAVVGLAGLASWGGRQGRCRSVTANGCTYWQYSETLPFAEDPVGPLCVAPGVPRRTPMPAPSDLLTRAPGPHVRTNRHTVIPFRSTR